MRVRVALLCLLAFVAAGWRVVNVYWPELDDPVTLGRRVKAFVRTPHAAVELR